MGPTITQETATTFRFEYEYPQERPKLMKGQTFEYEDKTYRIWHYQQVFGEQVYCSFLVLAKLVKPRESTGQGS